MQTDANVSPTGAVRPSLPVDVVMRREPVTGPMARWQSWRWVLADVLPAGEPLEADVHPPPPAAPQEVQPLPGAVAVEGARYWLYAGLLVTLYRDDAEGYFLNLNSPQPCFWVFWRADGEQMLDGEAVAVPQIVTLSYHDAGRWLDAQEKVDQVPAPPEVVGWLRAFVDGHYQPEAKRRRRPESFKPLTDRFGQPVRISTEKVQRGPGPQGGGHGG
ncbi:DUF3305 domain-containing protein [Hydrogenophaga sp. RWCD_12]|uniref:DUF3305 domain-containing protein n=1 Tax=Hydrogenophaga sp. RWCD_12 TaxID=3391190 RepID=UPI003984A94A